MRNTPFYQITAIIHEWYQNGKRKIANLIQKLQNNYNSLRGVLCPEENRGFFSR